MSSHVEVTAASVSMLNNEPTKSSAIPMRNAMTSVKRSTDFQRLGKFALKPIRLTELTQEMLEAENEPLKPMTIEEEPNENEQDAQGDKNSDEEIQHQSLALQAPEKSIVEITKNKCKSENSLDLGVSWLETPAKPRLITNFENYVCTATPTVNHNNLMSDNKQSLTSPTFIKNVTDDRFVNIPKVQCSIDIKPLLKTPINSFTLTNRRQTSQSLTKFSTPRNVSPTSKNRSTDAITSVKKVNYSKPGNFVINSNTKKSNSSLQEKNKENLKHRVQFSLPATQIRDHIFKEITVKGITYIVLNQLGRGGSSVVYHCFALDTNSERAIKKVDLGIDTNAVGYINEVKVLARLQKCDRIIKMYDYEVIDSEKLLLVVLERGGSDLAKILKDLSSGTKHLPLHMLIFYWMEMLYAVKQIHENGIIHSDLKPGNFLKAEGGLKLIDFGIASCMHGDMTSVARNVPVGSFNYISPEALTNEPSKNCESPSFGKPKYKVTYKSDVWSLGCMLYQFVYRKTPFQHIGHMWAKLGAILDPDHEIDFPEVDWVPLKIVNTIKNCLQYDMKSRPSVDELIREYENIYY